MWLFGRQKKDRNKNSRHANETTPLNVGVTSTFSSTLNENPFAKYGLGSPPRRPDGSQPVSVEQAEKNIKKDGRRIRKLFNKGGHDTQKMLIFLYGRAFMARKPKKKRVECILRMIEVQEASDRLLQVVKADGDNDLSRDSAYMRRYAELVIALRRYFRLSGSFGFVPDMDEVLYFFRFQNSGNCFLLGVCVMASYLAQKSGGETSPYPVDASKFIRHSFSDERLYSYVVKDSGGEAVKEMNKLVCALSGKTKSNMETFSAAKVRNDPDFHLEHELEIQGPGLVNGFAVHKNFEDATCFPKESESKIGIVQFDGASIKRTNGEFMPLEAPDGVDEQDEIEAAVSELENRLQSLSGANAVRTTNLFPADSRSNASEEAEDSSSSGDVSISDSEEEKMPADGGRKKKQEFHSMVLLGGRRVGQKTYLLCQNWWPDMPLVELSDDYFKAADGELSFVVSDDLRHFDKLSSGSSFHSVNGSPLADCNNLDRADAPQKEGFYDDPKERSFT